MTRTVAIAIMFICSFSMANSTESYSQDIEIGSIFSEFEQLIFDGDKETLGTFDSMQSGNCAIDLPNSFSPAEQYAWQGLCTNGATNVSSGLQSDYDDPGCTLAAEDNLYSPNSSALSQNFFDLILHDERYSSNIKGRSIKIRCATIPSLNLQGRKVGAKITFIETAFGEIDITHSEFDSSISFLQSYMLGSLNAYGAKFNSHLTVDNTLIKDDFNISYAKVNGALSLSGSRINGRILAREVSVAGSVFANSIKARGDVSFYGSSIGGNVQVGNGSIFGDDFNLQQARIGGWAYFGSSDEDRSGAKVHGTLNASQMKSHGIQLGPRAKYLKDVSVSFSEIGLIDVDKVFIGGDLRAERTRSNSMSLFDVKVLGRFSTPVSEIKSIESYRSIFHEEVDINSAIIADVLIFRESRFDKYVKLSGSNVRYLDFGVECAKGSTRCGVSRWGSESSLDLENASVGELAFDLKSGFRRSDGTWLPIVWDQSSYDVLSARKTATNVNTPFTVYEAQNLIEILEGTRRTGGLYRPQPYLALEAALTNSGNEEGAREVAYARLWHRATTRTSWGAWLWDRFLWITVGFGVYPAMALLSFSTIVAIGAFVARRWTNVGMDCRWLGFRLLHCALYSVETAIPLMETSATFSDLKHDDSPAVRAWFSFQKIVGFVLATVLVGSLAFGV